MRKHFSAIGSISLREIPGHLEKLGTQFISEDGVIETIKDDITIDTRF